MIDGFFRIAFTGAAGSGFGILALRDGSIAGADVGGAIYDGTYSENAATAEVDIKVTMAAPAGVTPVQTGVPCGANECPDHCDVRSGEFKFRQANFATKSVQVR